MKFLVEFTAPVHCSCIVNCKDAEEAWNLVNDYTFKQLKQLGYNPQVDNGQYENSECDVIDVKRFEENKKQ